MQENSQLGKQDHTTLQKIYSVTENELIKRCARGEEKAQKFLYDKYKSVFMGICMRYLKNPTWAEEALVESFLKIFTRINQYDGRGSFEGWMKRICVNESLMHLRKLKKIRENKNEIDIDMHSPASGEQNMIDNDILKLLERLPDGYRTVFNLYVIEGFKHREIAEKLGISINTSKSQLIMARKRLKKMLENMDYPGISNYL